MRSAMRSARWRVSIGAFVALSAVPVGRGVLAQTAGNAAALATVKSDLRRLVGENEVYHAKNRRYAADLASLPGYKASATVTITMVTVSATGWSGTASSGGAPGKSCTIWVGTVPSHPTTAALGLSGPEAVPTCDRP
jgi:hypothetical protein